MTDPYLTILARAKVQGKTDAKEIKRLRFELGKCKALVGRYRDYFKEKFSRKKKP
jgi:hypothetical protein